MPKIGEGFGEWSEAPSYEEGVGVDGEQQGSALQKTISVPRKRDNGQSLGCQYRFGHLPTAGGDDRR